MDPVVTLDEPVDCEAVNQRAAQETLRASQTLQRGLDILDFLAFNGPSGLSEIGQAIQLTRSTTYRLALALSDRGLVRSAGGAYQLGPKLLSLAESARLQRSLTGLARPHLESLARDQLDAVNLAVRDGQHVRYMDQARGARRMTVRSVVGEVRPLASTALGRALLLDASEAEWRRAYDAAPQAPSGENALLDWLGQMRRFRDQGAAFDIEENGDRDCCVAAPIREASGRIVAALSLSSLPQYLDKTRMAQLAQPVTATADAIAAELGWTSLRRQRDGTNRLGGGTKI